MSIGEAVPQGFAAGRLVIAETDLAWRPLSHRFARWVVAPGVDPTAVQPDAADLIDKASY